MSPRVLNKVTICEEDQAESPLQASGLGVLQPEGDGGRVAVVVADQDQIRGVQLFIVAEDVVVFGGRDEAGFTAEAPDSGVSGLKSNLRV